MRTPIRRTWLPKHVSDLTTQVGQDHTTTGVLLVLGTNNHLHGIENAAEQQLEHYWPTPVRPVSTTGQTGPCWQKLRTSIEGPYTGQVGVAHRSDRSKTGNPKSTKQTTELQTDPNSKYQQHGTKTNSLTFTQVKTH
jgi:hypothetical protein